MTLVTVPVLLLVLSVGTASLAFAAGGGGSAAGGDAQRGILKQRQTGKSEAKTDDKANASAPKDKAVSEPR